MASSMIETLFSLVNSLSKKVEALESKVAALSLASSETKSDSDSARVGSASHPGVRVLAERQPLERRGRFLNNRPRMVGAFLEVPRDKLCRFGDKCRTQETCPFYHSDKDKNTVRKVDMTGKRPCNKMANGGKCDNESCSFAHTPAALTTSECRFGKRCDSDKCQNMHGETKEEYFLNFLKKVKTSKKGDDKSDKDEKDDKSEKDDEKSGEESEGEKDEKDEEKKQTTKAKVSQQKIVIADDEDEDDEE